MTLKRIALALAVMGTTPLFAVHIAAPAAHAAGITPSITAIADARSYGVLEVAGLNFSANDPVEIQVLESSTGAWHTVASTGASRSGSFVKVFSFAVSCSAQAAAQVTLVAVDTATHEVTASVVQALSTPMALANAQMASAKTATQLASAQAAVAAARVTMQQNAAACQAAS